jgi:hypothetical protein
VREATGISHKNYSEISRLKEIGNNRDADNRSFKVRIDAMNIELDQNNNRIVHLTDVREQKEIDI